MRLILSLFLLILTSASHASFSEACFDLFTRPPLASSFGVQQKITRLGVKGLPQEALDLIDQHKISQLKDKIPAEGAGIVFHFVRGFNEDGSIYHNLKGEAQQAFFVKEVLKYLFPRAEFAFHSQPVDNKKNIYFRIQDLAENSRIPEDTPREFVLDMTVVKPANPGILMVDKQKAREALGLDPQRKVLSVYLQRQRYFEDMDFQIIISELIQNYGFQDVIVSVGNSTRPAEEDGYRQLLSETTVLEDQFTDFKNLSQMESLKSSPEQVRWIFNDITGVMPQVHAIANLAIVFGPINFFEPLSVGTPTALVLPYEFNRLYNNGMLNGMIAKASAASGFVHVRSQKDFFKEIPSLLNGPSAQSPALIPSGFFPHRPIDNFLSVLDASLRKQIK